MPTFLVRKMDDGNGLHIEAPGCVVNIRANLNDGEHEVTNVSVNADGDRYSGDPQWWVATDDVRVERSGIGMRIIKYEDFRP